METVQERLLEGLTMLINKQKGFSEAFNRFKDECTNLKRIVYIDRDHTPYTKRKGEVMSSLQIDFDTYKGKYLSICMYETTTSRPGHSATRVISVAFDYEDAMKLAVFINDYVK